MDIKQHFKQLQNLLDEGLITQQQFEQRSEALLDELGGTSTQAKDGGYTPRRQTLVELTPGMQIGPEERCFELVKELGGGAMGRVWLARDRVEESLEGGIRYKALKVVAPELLHAPRALENLKREAMRASQLAHPNIVNVHYFTQGPDKWLFVVMEYLKGQDLDQYLLERGEQGLGLERTLAILKPIAKGLDYAHSRPEAVIHRDLKPGNIYLDQNGEVKILDFGLAYQLRKSASRSAIQADVQSSSGTVEYMPPEAFLAGKPHPAQDLYALACITYELLTGEPPYSAELAPHRTPQTPMPPMPEALSDAKWQILQQGLSFEQQSRPLPASGFIASLAEAEQKAKRLKEQEVLTNQQEDKKASQLEQQEDEQDYKQACQSKTLLGYETYLARKGVARYRNEVENALKVLKKKDSAEKALQLADKRRIEAEQASAVPAHPPETTKRHDHTEENWWLTAGVLVGGSMYGWLAAGALIGGGVLWYGVQDASVVELYKLAAEKTKRIAHLTVRSKQDASVAEFSNFTAEKPKRLAHLTVRSNVRGDTVYIDGKPVGATGQQAFELPPGSYRIEIRKAGYESYQQQVSLFGGQSQTIRGELQQRGLSLEPALVTVPGGCFEMGSPADEKGRDVDERQHRVCLEEFYLAKYELTVGAFSRFVEKTGYKSDAEKNSMGKSGCYAFDRDDETKWEYKGWANWSKPNKYQENQPSHPVGCVSFNDAQAYIDWLNKQTGKAYRLPTEAEWEYAARAGSSTAYPWSDEVDEKACRYGNVADKGNNWSNSFPCDDPYKWSAPVGAFEPNAWGLADMYGNQWEWTCSAYDKGYGGAEKRCAEKGAEGLRVLRGGSWTFRPRRLRSAGRDGSFRNVRYIYVGFRLAQDKIP